VDISSEKTPLHDLIKEVAIKSMCEDLLGIDFRIAATSLAVTRGITRELRANHLANYARIIWRITRILFGELRANYLANYARISWRITRELFGEWCPSLRYRRAVFGVALNYLLSVNRANDLKRCRPVRPTRPVQKTPQLPQHLGERNK